MSVKLFLVKEGGAKMNSADVLKKIAEGRGDFRGETIKGCLALGDAACNTYLDLRDTRIKDGLSLTRIRGLSLARARMPYLDLRGAIVDGGGINLESAQITDKVGGSIILEGATIKGNLDLTGTKIEGNPYVSGVGFLNLRNAMIEANLILTGAAIEGNLYLEHVKIKGSFSLDGADVKGQIYCGDNIALALQCFFYFGNRIHISTEAAKEIAEALMSKRKNLV